MTRAIETGSVGSQLRLTTDIPLSYLGGPPFALTQRSYLVLTWGATTLAAALGAAPWLCAGLGCCLFPGAAALAGLIPNPSRSLLLGRNHPSVLAS